MAASAYFTKQQLEDRLSAAAVREIFDDNNDGNTDTNPINRFISDCSSEVDSFIRPIYPVFPLPTPIPNEITRLALDCAEYRAAKRFPDVVRMNWIELRKAAHEDLNNLRSGKTRLDWPNGLSPNPPSNVGATVGTSLGSKESRAEGRCRPPSKWEDMGDF